MSMWQHSISSNSSSSICELVNIVNYVDNDVGRQVCIRRHVCTVHWHTSDIDCFRLPWNECRSTVYKFSSAIPLTDPQCFVSNGAVLIKLSWAAICLAANTYCMTDGHSSSTPRTVAYIHRYRCVRYFSILGDKQPPGVNSLRRQPPTENTSEITPSGSWPLPTHDVGSCR